MAGSDLFKLVSPLGDDLLFYRMRALEGLSRVSCFELECLSENDAISVDDILAQNVHVEMKMPDESLRYFAGYVTRFAQAGMHGRFHVYRATVHAWMWFLTRTADCRIFQEKTVPVIVKEVFADHPTADFEDRLSGNYETREYCVQYRETDFNFVSRLLEEEGIYYYFEFDGDQNKLILVDSMETHSPFPGYDQVPYIKPSGSGRSELENIAHWEFRREFKPGKWAHTDYDFKKPNVKLDAKALIERNHPHADYEVFDFPGEYLVKGDGEVYAQTRIEEVQRGYEVAEGSANARGIAVGCSLSVYGHPRADQNAEYLVTRSEMNCQAEGFESDGLGGATYDVGFEVLNTEHVFRPERRTPRPLVKGPQTAVVVGPAGDEIHTDEYGRVKVQFFWDRYGNNDENSSCWMRVSHPWAGKNWGMIAIPRIGQEVIVECLEGDPDRPIITGRVYNANQMPPYDLPANATQTGIKSRSSKGGGAANFNEIRFEDKKGAEQVYVHAERNMDTMVEADETLTVGHDRTKKVGNDEETEIGNNRSEKVVANEDIEIGGNRTEKVGGKEDITIGMSRTEKVGTTESVTIGASRTTNIGASDTLTIAASQSTMIGASQSVTVAASYSLTAGAAISLTAGGPASITAAAGINLTTPAAVNVTAPAGMNLLGGTQINGLTTKSSWLSAIKYGVTGIATDMKGVVVETIGVKTSAVTAKSENIAFKNATKGLDKVTAGLQMINPATKITQGALALRQAALQIFS
ncbi:MAG: type VI secretion system tip protein VgrG [Rhodocyclaceae bacterium]|nr:type VI secretion system tip protein VgrG [Rhodocyclaceae bacterium]